MNSEDNHESVINKDFIITAPRCNRNVGAGGVGKLFYDKMKSYGNDILQIDFETGLQDTYSSLLQRCVKTAWALKEEGVCPGDVILTWTDVHANIVVPFLASLFIGAVPANFDTGYPEECIPWINYIKPKVIFADLSVATIIQKALKLSNDKTKVILFETDFEAFATFNGSTHEFVPENISDLRSTAIILLTSGSTGSSKLVRKNHLAYINSAFNLISSGVSTERSLLIGSLACSTVPLRIGAVILTRGSWVIVSRPSNPFDIIDKYKITMCFMDPNEVRILLHDKYLQTEVNASLKTLIVGGGSIAREEITAIKRLFKNARIIPSYGMTENGPILQFNTNSEHDMLLLEQNPESSGRPIAGFQYKVVNIDTQKPVGPNQIGELRVKTNSSMDGYINWDINFWDDDGFCKTGDMFYYDLDFCFYFVDRYNQMFLSQGKMVSPLYLERILRKHPDVDGAAVVGIPDGTKEYTPIAVVVLRYGVADTVKTIDEITRYLNSQVDESYRLKDIKNIAALPLTTTGKIKKQLLKTWILNGSI